MNHAIILAAGQGQRMKMRDNKMLVKAGGRPLIYHSIMAFNDHPEIETITIVTNKINKTKIEQLVKECHFPKVTKIILGGLLRHLSLEKGLDAIKKPSPQDIVLVHNGANPLLAHDDITEIIFAAQETGAAICGHAVTSTIKEVDDKHIIKTHDRKKLFAAETPQAATYKIMKKALEHAMKNKLQPTDEAMMFEAIGQPTAFIEASAENFKITSQADLTHLRAHLGDLPEDFRIGLGQDSHLFEEAGEEKGDGADGGGSCLILAGLKIPGEPKLAANSDGDVILHAIFNAISQAIGDQSLGVYADPMCEKGIKDSKKYLEIALKNMRHQGFKINSLGLMIEARTPKFDKPWSGATAQPGATLASQIKSALASILNVDSRRIGVTSTSGEHVTIFGEGRGIQCFAIVSLVKE